jgi:cbb3-type cytochrome c oxidase subunit III
VRLRSLGTAAALLAAMVAAGCGSAAAEREEAGSTARGKQLFVDNCGSCHKLEDAGTPGVIGPDLDEAFHRARDEGFDETTIRDVVRGQIAYPTVEPVTGEPGMPANLVTGQDADDVAAYVAAVAGGPVQGGDGGGEAAPPSDPKQLFADNCGSCHTLADAGTSGTIGPNLDQAMPALDRAIQQITNGGGAMPPFRDQLTEAQIRAIAEYVAGAAGRG